MGNQHLAHGGFVANQLYQLIDAVLLEQIFRALLLQHLANRGSAQAFTASASASPAKRACCCMVLSGVRIWQRSG